MTAPRVLIVAEHASARFGGEAALPLHYFRVLRARGHPVWLVTHARTRDELQALYPGEERIRYVEDSAWHRAMWRLGRRLPAQIAYVTTGFASRVATQFAQRRIARELIAREAIDVVHQPMPVSPREPSLLFGLGVPVVIGPMNGGMDFPPPFRRRRGRVERGLVLLGRCSAALLHRVLPGKRRAALLLVANRRTRDALPAGVGANVVELVENGVDPDLWRRAGADREPPAEPTGPVEFVFMGRLVDWKAVDIAVHAFARARAAAPMRLVIIGDGDQRRALEGLSERLGVGAGATGVAGTVEFTGWLPQAACAARIAEADALVLPSLLECGGAVVLEAMALGKPVVATAWGGPLDYLDPECGILVAPDSVDAMIDSFARAMVELATSAERRIEMGRRAAVKARRMYDWESKVDRVLELYEQTLRRDGVAAAAPAAAPRRVYCVLSARSLPYARFAFSSLLERSVAAVDLTLVTDDADDKTQIEAAMGALAVDPRHAWRVYAKADADERAATLLARHPNVAAFRSGHPCWRKITDPPLFASAGEEMVILDPDLYFPNRFDFEPTPASGVALMHQKPHCLLPPEVVERAYARGVRLAHHTDIGVAQLRSDLDLDWLDDLIGRLGGKALPRAMHIEAIVWAAMALRFGGGYLDPEHWHCWRNSQWKRVARGAGVAGPSLLRVERFASMKCFHGGGIAKWWIADAIVGGIVPAPGAVGEARPLRPFEELTPAGYRSTQRLKAWARRAGYYRVFKA